MMNNKILYTISDSVKSKLSEKKLGFITNAYTYVPMKDLLGQYFFGFILILFELAFLSTYIPILFGQNITIIVNDVTRIVNISNWQIELTSILVNFAILSIGSIMVYQGWSLQQKKSLIIAGRADELFLIVGENVTIIPWSQILEISEQNSLIVIKQSRKQIYLEVSQEIMKDMLPYVVKIFRVRKVLNQEV